MTQIFKFQLLILHKRLNILFNTKLEKNNKNKYLLLSVNTIQGNDNLNLTVLFVKESYSCSEHIRRSKIDNYLENPRVQCEEEILI